MQKTQSIPATPIGTPPVNLPAGAIPGLSVAAFGSAISLRVCDSLLPRLVSEFSLSLGQAATVITVFAIAYGLSQLLFGPLGDRFGKYRVIAWGCAACAVTAAGCALAPSFQVLLVARTLAGATAASIIPLSMAWIGDVTSYEGRQPILARFLIGQILGISAGVLLGGYAADHLHWRTPFWGIAVLFALTAFGLLWINGRLPPQARLTLSAGGGSVARMVSEFRQVLAIPWARVIVITVFTEGAFLYGAFAYIVSHLHQTHGIALALAGQVAMLYGFGGLLFALSARTLVKRLGESGLSLWGGAIVAASFMVIAIGAQWWWSVPACFCAGLGFYMLHNTLQINATQMAPDRRGAAVAAFAAAFFTGQSVGIAINGALIERIGTAGVIAMGAVGVLLLSLNFSRLLRLRNQGLPNQGPSA